MALVGMRDVRIHFGGPVLLDGISFHIEPGQRVCLTGRNGTGKTTLMRLLSGEQKPDSGEVILTPGKRIAVLPQEVPTDLQGSVAEIVSQGAEHHAAEGDWKVELEAERWIEKAGLPSDIPFTSLSGGQKRRVLLARALASAPDLLLLDEPTNHLDIASIDWMEEVLRSSRVALLFVTHDRAFLRRMATRILELDRGKIFDWACDWDTFLVRKDALLEAQEKEWALFDKKLAQEETWVRRGVKARRKRNEGRVRALKAMRTERSERRERQGNVTLQVSEAERSGRKVLEAKDLAFSYPGSSLERPLIANCSTIIQRGDKVAILGPNGSGKTTLLRLLLGQLKPDSGSTQLGAAVEVLYFDQMRGQIDPEATVKDNISGGQEYVTVGGRQKHVMGYLQDFLFDPQRSLVKASVLSGGERNRLLLARLFTKPSNLLVLDEPTNDLDAETLELLEDLLVEFDGTVLMVSHDREFLDNVATSVLAIDELGVVQEFVGGWSDWQRQDAARRASPNRGVTTANSSQANSQGASTLSAAPAAQTPKGRKRSFKETREWESLPPQIETLEAQQAVLIATMGEPSFYRKPAAEIAETQKKQDALTQEIATCYARWEELDALS